MDRLDAMEMFVRVVETGSFTKVAQEFATTQPTVTKQVAAMEAHLKVRLLNRNTRGVSLTEPGALYYEKCKAIVTEVSEAENVVRVRQTQVHGQLRVGSSVAFGRRVVVPLALEFMAQNPQVQLDLSFEDRYTDLVAHGIDVAIRLGKLADSALGARTLGMNPWVLVASPTYLRRHGTPRRPSDLKDHATLIYSSVQGNDLWRLRNASGEAVSVPVTGRLRSNNLSGCWRRRARTWASRRCRVTWRWNRWRPGAWWGCSRPAACPSRRSTPCTRRPAWCRRRCRRLWRFCRGGLARTGWLRCRVRGRRGSEGAAGG